MSSLVAVGPNDFDLSSTVFCLTFQPLVSSSRAVLMNIDDPLPTFLLLTKGGLKIVFAEPTPRVSLIFPKPLRARPYESSSFSVLGPGPLMLAAIEKEQALLPGTANTSDDVLFAHLSIPLETYVPPSNVW